jgi:hypothetical protein
MDREGHFFLIYWYYTVASSVQLVVGLVNLPLGLLGGAFAYFLFIASGFLLLPLFYFWVRRRWWKFLLDAKKRRKGSSA